MSELSELSSRCGALTADGPLFASLKDSCDRYEPPLQPQLNRENGDDNTDDQQSGSAVWLMHSDGFSAADVTSEKADEGYAVIDVFSGGRITVGGVLSR